MKVVQHTKEIFENGFGATIGNFDGVHLGHIDMLTAVKDQCKKRGLKFAVITFFPHPAQILRAQRGFLITDYEQRRKLLESVGIDYLVEIPFTKQFSELSASSFIEQYIAQVDEFKFLALGYDFAFGANKEGDSNTIKKQLSSKNIAVESLGEYKEGESKISSTVIRELIRKGAVDQIEKFLGRPFSLAGTVVRGKGRGKGIGFPTANLRVSEEIIVPSPGVYTTTTILRHKEYRSVTNIGFNPTFNDNFHMTIETHIPAIDFDFYDEPMTVSFMRKIRDEKRFESIEELKSQIALDTQEACK